MYYATRLCTAKIIINQKWLTFIITVVTEIREQVTLALLASFLSHSFSYTHCCSPSAFCVFQSQIYFYKLLILWSWTLKKDLKGLTFRQIYFHVSVQIKKRLKRSYYAQQDQSEGSLQIWDTVDNTAFMVATITAQHCSLLCSTMSPYMKSGEL